MDEATAKYILNMDTELKELVDALARKAAVGELDERIDLLQQLSFRAGFYWDMSATIKSKTCG